MKTTSTTGYGVMGANNILYKTLDNLHWVGLVCTHGVKDGPQTWLSTIFADPTDEDAPAYAAHFFGRDRNIKKAALLGLNGPTQGIPGQVDDLRIITNPNPDVAGAILMFCRICGTHPDVTTQDVIDVTALWPKRVCGPTIDIRHLKHLANRWCN